MMTTEKYTFFAAFLHWLMAILILGMLVLGWYMVDLPKGSVERGEYFALHKSIGLSLALLVLIRIGWRCWAGTPAPSSDVLAWQRGLARAVHELLYLFMLIQPLSGYLSSSFSGYQTHFWGIPLPHWGWQNEPLNLLFTGVHEFSSCCLLVLIALHLGGVLVHVCQGKTHILARMWPF